MAKTRILEVVSAIHKKVREQQTSYEFSTLLEDWSNDLAKLSSSYNEVYCSRHLVGSNPQIPNTLLGLIAGWLIGIVQRLLFWYTPQIRQFQEATALALNRICSLEERKFRSFLSMADRLQDLEAEYRRLRSSVAGPLPDSRRVSMPAKEAQNLPIGDKRHSAASIDAEHLYFELQKRFQSREAEDIQRLEGYRSVLEKLEPSLPVGRWLDIGSGEGQWLQLVIDGGREAIGVDANPDAVAKCRSKGIEVAQADAVDYLSRAGDASLAVISAFHVLEHSPFEYSMNLVWQAARVLKSGGALLIETPNPGNVLMATEQFWLDPTHHRPIPMPLAEFTFEYCGFRVIHRFEVNPRPESEHLPFRELELAQRLDRLLYGPQDYAIIGRRD